MDDCIWALSLFIRLMEECSEAVLRAVGHVKENNDYKHSKYVTVRPSALLIYCQLDKPIIQLTNARVKIVLHLGQVFPFLPVMCDQV
jgi:hypothetical protein